MDRNIFKQLIPPLVLLIGVYFFGHRTPILAPAQISIASSSVASVAATHTEFRAQPATTHTYAVTKIVDGDTITIDMDGTRVTIRLIGMDTPETVDPRKPVQCFGKEASNKAKELLTGKMVGIEKDASQGTYDKYGRLLAYAHLPDGTLYNQHMIAQGYAHEYTYNLPYKYQKEFKAAQALAQSEKRGLWADDTCAGVTSGTSATSATPAPAMTSGFVPAKQYDCTKNVYNCSSFSTHAEAQYVFTLCGGDANDIHKLDSDRDGSVCEALP